MYFIIESDDELQRLIQEHQQMASADETKLLSLDKDKSFLQQSITELSSMINKKNTEIAIHQTQLDSCNKKTAELDSMLKHIEVKYSLNFYGKESVVDFSEVLERKLGDFNKKCENLKVYIAKYHR